MEGNYGVYLGKQAVGKVQVLRQGLYYRFLCRCSLNSGMLCRLMVSSGGKTENLGVLVPQGNCFCLERSLPVKRFPKGQAEFFLTAKLDQTKDHFVPICPEEPFAYVARLKRSYLAWKEGQAGIYIPEV